MNNTLTTFSALSMFAVIATTLSIVVDVRKHNRITRTTYACLGLAFLLFVCTIVVSTSVDHNLGVFP